MITRQHPPLTADARLRLQLRRIHAGLSVDEAARLGGYSTVEWERVETGYVGPDEEMLRRMAAVVDLKATVDAGFPMLKGR